MTVRPKKYLFRGALRPVAEIAAMIGVAESLIYYRLKKGLPFDQEPKKYLFRREWKTVAEVAALTGNNRSSVFRRIDGDRIREPESAPRYVTHDGKTLQLRDWARLTGICRVTLVHRLKRGWSVERALTEPVNPPAGSRRRLQS